MKLEQRQERRRTYRQRDPNGIDVHTRLDEETGRAFHRLADVEQRSDSSMAAILIREALQAREGGKGE